MAATIPESETLSLADGTSVLVSKIPCIGGDEWAATKKYLEENPDEARKMESFTKDAKSVKNFMQQQTLTDYYYSKIDSGDELTATKVLGLQHNPEFAHIFNDVKKGGTQAAYQHSFNEPLMAKVSRAVGGVPDEVKGALAKIQASPMTLHEACKMGDVKVVEAFLAASGGSLEATDAKGVTSLGYAVGANRIPVVKFLLDKKADASKCDTSGCNAVHYAAAYGRKDLLTFLLNGKVDVNAKNTEGQTPLALATKNKQTDTVDLLKTKGGSL